MPGGIAMLCRDGFLCAIGFRREQGDQFPDASLRPYSVEDGQPQPAVVTADAEIPAEIAAAGTTVAKETLQIGRASCRERV